MLNWLRKKEEYVPQPLTKLDPSFLEEADRLVDFTPDIRDLERFSYQRFFAYDETQPGLRKHELIKRPDAVDICSALTHYKFSLWKKNLRELSFPIPIHTPLDNPKYLVWRQNDFQNVYQGRIRGELFRIPTKVLIDLDIHKQNGLEFHRTLVPLLVPHTDKGIKKVFTTKAWMYVGIEQFWEDQFDAGYLFSPVKTYDGPTIGTRKDMIYHFTSNEYK